MKHLFVIDDTGSPGNNYESNTLKSDRKTYVSVFIDSKIRATIEIELNSLLEKYSTKERHISEFHFTDLINRRKEFVNFDSEEVIKIFKDFTNILNKYRLPFFNQTITPRTLEENGLKNRLNKSLDEVALDFLFLRIKNFIIENQIKNEFEILIDEGIKKKGQKVEIEILRSVTNENYMRFESSKNNILIQIADFFAFALNRNQLAMIKPKRTQFDIIVLSLLNSVFYGNPSSGSKPMLINDKKFSKDDYDKLQIEYFKKMGVYDYWKKVNN